MKVTYFFIKGWERRRLQGIRSETRTPNCYEQNALSLLMPVTWWVGQVKYCWKRGFIFLSFYKLSIHKSFIAFLSLVTWNTLLKYAWKYFASRIFIKQWNTEHKLFCGNIISFPHIASNWSAYTKQLFHVAKLRTWVYLYCWVTLCLQQMLLEIFLNNWLSPENPYFILVPPWFLLLVNKHSFFLALTFTGISSHWTFRDESLYNPLDISYYCT